MGRSPPEPPSRLRSWSYILTGAIIVGLSFLILASKDHTEGLVAAMLTFVAGLWAVLRGVQSLSDGND